MRKYYRRSLLSLILALIFVTVQGLATVGLAAKTPKPPKPKVTSAKLTILATSDVHGHILPWNYLIPKVENIGLSKAYSIIQKERALNPYNIVVDAGDFLQGSPLDSYYSKETNWSNNIHPMIQMYNYMSYDAVVLGNHEFNYGKTFLGKVIAGANFPVLSANTYDLKSGKVWAPVKPYTIKEVEIVQDKAKAKVKVAIIGVTTPAIPNWENAQNYAGLEFHDQVDATRRLVTQLRKQVDVILIVTHSGVEIDGQESFLNENQAAAIARACPEATLIVSGHKHAVIDNSNAIKDGNRQVVYDRGIIAGVPVMSPGRWATHVSRAEIYLERPTGKGPWMVREVSTANLPVADAPEDKRLSDLAWPYQDTTLQYLNTQIGNSTGLFSATDANLKDTPIIDLVNDVQRYYGKAQLASAAMFNSKAVIKPGVVKLQDIYSLYTFENYLYTIRVSGSQLRQYLEHAARYYKQYSPDSPIIGTNGADGSIADYNYDMVQGVNYTVDITLPTGSRIKDLTYQGTPVQDNDSFTLALNNYRYNGGGGYMAAMGFSTTTPAQVLFDSQKAYGDGGQIRDLIARYVQEKGSISPAADSHWTLFTGKTPVVPENINDGVVSPADNATDDNQ
ncbi:MAG TPA: 5'-nucleotidase C-terminal domain-containing protein [Patescibacteria group bacterium]|nr:5'-nucleotidase C-terminal domain-containing protein [Patescibacteria group bacterium]